MISFLGYSPYNYWTDASNQYASDKLSANAWTYSNNKLVSMAYDYWNSGEPATPETLNCAALMAITGHNLHGEDCNDEYFYVCEKWVNGKMCVLLQLTKNLNISITVNYIEYFKNNGSLPGKELSVPLTHKPNDTLYITL